MILRAVSLVHRSVSKKHREPLSFCHCYNIDSTLVFAGRIGGDAKPICNVIKLLDVLARRDICEWHYVGVVNGRSIGFPSVAA